MASSNFYSKQPSKAFWRAAVAEKHFFDLDEIWQPIALKPEESIATAGSCFAQHVGRAIKARGANYLDLEPPPPHFNDVVEAQRHGFGLFSCRYGNIYTSRQLNQLFLEAFGKRRPMEFVWKKGRRFFDALRPSVDPVGHDTYEDVALMRERHLSAVRRMFESVDLFVFTMGLTEGWESKKDGTMYPSIPGAICGEYTESGYAFHNLRFDEIYADMKVFWTSLKRINKQAKLLLTVSPVPLVATATSNHVLPATVYSKSVLRAVAGDLAQDLPDVHYFPSFELISSHPSRGMFFSGNLRDVNSAGVEYVMSHFFRAAPSLAGSHGTNAVPKTGQQHSQKYEIICDEEALDQSASTSTAFQRVVNGPATPNSIRNSTNSGAVPGTPGTLPTNHTGASSGNGLTRQIVGIGTENGIAYYDVRFSGTPTVSSGINLYPDSATKIPTVVGETWTGSMAVKLVGGSLRNLYAFIQVIEVNTEGVFLDASATKILPTSEVTQNVRHTRTFNHPATAFAVFGFRLKLTLNHPVDATFRLGLWRLENVSASGEAYSHYTADVLTPTTAQPPVTSTPAILGESGAVNGVPIPSNS